MEKNFYITTTLPYVNAAPHIGFALEIVQADIIARYERMKGSNVIFNTGTDEHGVKIYRKALEEKKDPQVYVDENAKKFDELKQALNLSYTRFIRTTDPHHITAAQEFWKRCEASGDIEKKIYRVKYCVGCELEKTDSELQDGKCPIHPNLELEEIKEENYFFKFSTYEKKLLEWYETHPNFVLPDFRFNEIKQFVKNGLADFSISRLKEKMPWGVPVPGDDTQVMYVWFDALVNYVSTLGWPEDEKTFEKFWGRRDNPNAVQVAGKDNLRQQSAMWQAMLMSAGLPPSKQIIIHGFIISGGQKMAKSLGNVVDPFEIVKKYGTDALRFWIAHEMNTFEDGDFTEEKFVESYNANLANGIGNLTSRIMKMAISNDISVSLPSESDGYRKAVEILSDLEEFSIKTTIQKVWNEIRETDRYIQETEPFRVIKIDEKKGKKIMEELVLTLWNISFILEPFLPDTALIIRKMIQERIVPQPMFVRK